MPSIDDCCPCIACCRGLSIIPYLIVGFILIGIVAAFIRSQRKKFAKNKAEVNKLENKTDAGSMGGSTNARDNLHDSNSF